AGHRGAAEVIDLDPPAVEHAQAQRLDERCALAEASGGHEQTGHLYVSLSCGDGYTLACGLRRLDNRRDRDIGIPETCEILGGVARQREHRDVRDDPSEHPDQVPGSGPRTDDTDLFA